MGLITKTVMVQWNGKTKKYYENLGYKFTKIGDKFEIKTEHLPIGNRTKVECECDMCGEKFTCEYGYLMKKMQRDGGKTYCKKCSHIKNGVDKYKNTMLSKGMSFSEWCNENKFGDVLKRWDYSLNNCSPDKVSCYTKERYWFKCDKHIEHKSELKKISNFTTGHVGTMDCKQCSSLAQWFIDNDMDISKYWDYEKNNEIDPWTLSTGNQRQKIWIKCQEKEYHGSYKTTSDCFTKGKRCPYCSGRNTHPKDSLGAYITNKYGKDFLERVWSNRNKNSPFELAVNSNKKVIWKCGDNLHKEYLRSCDKSVRYEFRCPECVKRRKESLIQEKTRIYLEMLGYTPLTEYKCTISPINPKTNSKMDRKTFDFSDNNIPKDIKNNPCNILPLPIVNLISF